MRLFSRALLAIGITLFCVQCSPFPPQVDGETIANDKHAIWSQWPVVLSEPFQDNRRRWLIGAIDDAFAKGMLSVGSKSLIGNYYAGLRRLSIRWMEAR